MSSKKRFIAVAGNIGAGETERVGFLSKWYGLKPFLEPNDANPYLEDFYRDMKGFAFKSQIYFLTPKLRLHRELEKESGTVVQDRTIYEDAEIFARNLHKQGAIDNRDWQTYHELYTVAAQALAPPDLMIYLRAPVRTLRKRITGRGRAMEKDIPTSNLKLLNDLYEDWLSRYDLSPVITLASDKLDYITDLVDRLEILGQIEKYL